MDASVRNLLYRNPQFYEVAIPEPNDETPTMCRRMFARYLGKPPRSILDIGCGTGRDLHSLSRECPDCWGVDYLPEMIDYAKAQRPHMRLQVGDMRSVAVGAHVRRCHVHGLGFHVCNHQRGRGPDLGDVRGAFASGHAAHSRHQQRGQLSRQRAFPAQIRASRESAGILRAARSTYSFDRRKQLLVRRRTWTIDGQGEVEDFCEYRLFLPAELEHLLGERGFRVVGMFDNMELRETDLSGPRLYTAAIFGP